MSAKPSRLSQIALAECRAAATFPILRKHYFKAERLKNLHCCNTYVRLVVTDESVVPENDLPPVAAVCDRRIFARS